MKKRRGEHDHGQKRQLSLCGHELRQRGPEIGTEHSGRAEQSHGPPHDEILPRVRDGREGRDDADDHERFGDSGFLRLADDVDENRDIENRAPGAQQAYRYPYDECRNPGHRRE